MNNVPEGVFSIIADVVNNLLKNDDLSPWHVFLALMFVALLNKLRSVISVFEIFTERHLISLNRMANNEHLENSDADNIEFKIRNIVRYRITGIEDVERQCIVNSLLKTSRHLVAPDFFKKFRTFLIVKNANLIFVKNSGTHLFLHQKARKR